MGFLLLPPGGSELLAQLTAETAVATKHCRDASGNQGSNGERVTVISDITPVVRWARKSMRSYTAYFGR